MSTTRSSAMPEPIHLIIDTDMGNDVDDALALALAYALERRGECRVRAVTLTNPDPEAGVYIDAFNRFYGREDVPIGVSPDAPHALESPYLRVARAPDGAGRPLYPNNHDASRAPRSVDLLRRTLAAAPDQGVALVQIGFFTNLARLLDSAPDDASPLSGRELIKRKVRLVSLMAGAFRVPDKRMIEFNVRQAIPAARHVAEYWPTPMIWSGWEIGDAIRFPAAAIDHGFAHAKHHILPDSYQAYNPTPHERPTWDLTSVLHAVYPDHDYFGLSEPGRVIVEEDGFTWLKPEENGRDRYLTVSEAQAARARRLFEAHCTEPLLHT